ncbi:MAG: hypothetical protein ABIR94_09910 [Rubrivivax sp.]
MQETVQDRRHKANADSSRNLAERATELLSPATQIVGDGDAYLQNTGNDIGRRIGDDQLELFVVCHPVEAMLQQFSQLSPDFIALHDIGGSASTRLLAAVAGASKRKLQSLVIRRQGNGVALATLQFVELPWQPGRTLRVYSTQIDGDTQTRHQLAQVMLAHSRLGVLMVGELPAHATASSLQPLRSSIAAGPWPNRHLLLVPLAAAPMLPAQAATLAGNSGVVVRTTPQVNQPTDAWSYISGAWNLLNSQDAAAPVVRKPAAAPAAVDRSEDDGWAATQSFEAPPTATVYVANPAYAVTQPLGLSPMPSTGSPVTTASDRSAMWSAYIQRCMNIQGITQACVFDVQQQRSLAHSGSPRMAERLAAKGSMLHDVMVDTAKVLGLGSAEPDAAITLAQHLLLIRPMPGKPGISLHLVLDRSHGNIGLARAQLQQIDQALLGGSA